MGVFLSGDGKGEESEAREGRVLQVAVWSIVLANAIEGATGPEAVWVYVLLSVPVKSVAGTCWGVATKSLFTKALSKHASGQFSMEES